MSNPLDAIKTLYEDYFGEVCQFIQGRFGSGPPDPEDVAQTSFMRLAEQDQAVIRNPKGFLMTTARNLVVDYHRSPKNVQPTDDQVEMAEKRDDAGAFAPESITMSQQQAAIVEQVLMQLSERDRGFVLKNRLEGMSYTDIAKETGMSRSGVQKIIMQALDKCLQALEERNGIVLP